MKFESEFIQIPLEDLHREAAIKKTEGWRFIQTHAVNTDDGVDLYYSFMKNGHIQNLKVVGVTKDMPVPSVTDLFLAGFVFENEARELFGVDMRDIAIDFSGAMYAPAEVEPMTFMSPEQKAAREKARKAQEAKAAKEAGAEAKPAAEPATKASPSGKRVFVMTPERKARLDAKLATMSPEKVAKVEAALKELELTGEAAPDPVSVAGAATADDKPAATSAPLVEEKTAQEKPAPAEAQKVDHDLEQKLALLPAEKAQRVKAALAARKGEPVEAEEAECAGQAALDPVLEAKINLLDADKADKVRAAIAARSASKKKGE